MLYPELDPIALDLGPLKVRWYGVMYLVGFAAAWWLGRRRAARPGSGWKPQDIDDLIFYCAIGVVAGGRLGYILFYGFQDWLADPLRLLRIWEGGMSFHGGLLGVLIAVGLFCRAQGRLFFAVTDFLAPLVPIGLGAGRIGNFINGELWGAPTTSVAGMQLPCARFPEHCAGLPADVLFSLPHHASQLYEAALEGLVLFLILWVYSSRPRPTMAVSGLFLVGYGAFRFLVEFVRLPDAHLGYLAFDWLTMGQLLTVPMVVAGAALMALAHHHAAAGPARRGDAG
jgi:phosphatidylglycerol:prolipoprotein diacylglycerol transferase